MEAKRAARSYTELAGLAHWLKGTGGTLGFDCFREPAQQLERFANEGNDGRIGETLQRLRSLQKRVVAS
jgi:hypothetical protein